MSKFYYYLSMSFIYVCVLTSISVAFYMLYKEYMLLQSNNNSTTINVDIKYKNLICNDKIILNTVNLYEPTQIYDIWIYESKEKQGTYRPKKDEKCHSELSLTRYPDTNTMINSIDFNNNNS